MPASGVARPEGEFSSALQHAVQWWKQPEEPLDALQPPVRGQGRRWSPSTVTRPNTRAAGRRSSPAGLRRTGSSGRRDDAPNTARRVMSPHPPRPETAGHQMHATDAPPLPSSRHRVAIVGAGFGGLFAAKALRRADVEVTIIDRTNHHLFQPLLYQMATGILAEGDIAPPIRDILRRQRNASVLLGEVQAIDLDARRLTVDTLGLRSEVAYDSLILATGATAVVLRPPGVRLGRARDEDDRRRAGAARADLRRVRDGRAGTRSAAAQRLADVRGRRRRARPASSWRARSPSSRAGRCAATSAASIPRSPGSCCWTRLRRS